MREREGEREVKKRIKAVKRRHLTMAHASTENCSTLADLRRESLTMYYCLSKIMEKRQIEMCRERERERGVLLEEFYLWELLGYIRQLNSNCRFTHRSGFFFDVLDCYCFFLLSD